MNVQKQARELIVRQRQREQNRRASLQALLSSPINRTSFELSATEYFH